MGGKPFVCPVCGNERITLRNLLTCCPHQLRVMTGNLARLRDGSPRLADLLGGHISDSMRRRLLPDTQPADPVPARGAGDDAGAEGREAAK